VARVEQSEIRERSKSFKAAPGFHCVQSAYYEENKKEAERRKTLFRNLRSLAGCGTAPTFILPRMRGRKRRGQHIFRRSTAALTKGSRRP